MASPELERHISLPLLTLYGLGTIVGAGIFVLIGEVAALAGRSAPVSFLLAGFVAAFTAITYGELAARFPLSAGEAAYLEEAFGRRLLAASVGYAIILTGIVSSGTLAQGFSGYLTELVPVPPVLATVGVILALAVIAAVGIELSAWTAAVVSVIQLVGLCLVVFFARDAFAELPGRWTEMIPDGSGAAWLGVGLGALLAFYAFIGFEDMVNVAEEVRDPSRVVPVGILIALITATAIYLVVSVVIVFALPLEELSASRAPLAEVLERRGAPAYELVAITGMLAASNSLLVQIIMASRVAYGMGRRGLAPAWVSRVNPRTSTPLLSTGIVLVAIILVALWLPLVMLAQLTSVLILMVFSAVNAALWWLKRLPQPQGVHDVPRWVPLVGAILCLLLVLLQIRGWTAG